MERFFMKYIVCLGFLLTCLTLQCGYFIDSVWQKTQGCASRAWDMGCAACESSYSRLPTQEEAHQHCLRAMSWVVQKTPHPVKEKISDAYQVSREKALQGYAWAYENAPSQEEIEQRSKETFDWVKEGSIKTYHYLDGRVPEEFKRWITVKKNFSFDISKKIYLNVGVWLSKLGTVIEQTNI